MANLHPDWTIRELNPSRDVDAVTALSLACADYALLETGELPNSDSGITFFADVAPGKELRNMLKLGIVRSDGSLAGVVDIARSYPAENAWYIGLLLLHPDMRRRGIGRAVIDWVDEAARVTDASHLLLCVVEENEAGLSFWRRLGFTEVRHVGPHQFGRKVHRRVELMRPVGPNRRASTAPDRQSQATLS